MDTLISTGTLAAFVVSAVNVVHGVGPVYFDTATMLLLIITIGRLIEASIKCRTSRTIKEMMELTPKTACVLRDGLEIEVPAQEVVEGEMLVVRPGEHLPTDGLIISGECLVEEAAFTGEAVPRSCASGDKIFGGSVNLDGLITVKATATGAASLLSQIQEMVRVAREEKAPVELMAQRVASAFVPIVWLIALGAIVYWSAARHDTARGLLSALAVLVVACPCALGLATPMATCIAIGKAARAGVLIRSGEVLERLPKLGMLFFDKTGTLTTGKLAVVETHSSIDCATLADEALAWAGSLARGSEHTVSKAIADEAEARGLAFGQVIDFKTRPGMGIEGMVIMNGDSRKVTIGSLKLLAQEHCVSQDLARLVDGQTLTVTFVGWDGKTRAAISLKDTVRPEAATTVEYMQAAGVKLAVISGDAEIPTRKLGAKLGIQDVFWECAPADKAALIRKAREHSKGIVAMVGDGINDSPALAEADIGIATGGGTDLARESSDITLLGDDLSRIPWALELSRLTYKTIRQNLWWAFGYNAAAISLAFFGIVHPLIAAVAMVLSSAAVITNSMKLAR